MTKVLCLAEYLNAYNNHVYGRAILGSMPLAVFTLPGSNYYAGLYDASIATGGSF